MTKENQQIKHFILEQVEQHPNDLVAFCAKKLNVSRVTIHRHLAKLLATGKVIKSGVTSQVSYYLASAFREHRSFSIEKTLSEYLVWNDFYKEAFSVLPKNIFVICEYGFTEIFNNAIDHSHGNSIVVHTSFDNSVVIIDVIDDGIGVFRNLQNILKFDDPREGVVALANGKVTTDSVDHTGEGIFFSSRAFDRFLLSANNISYGRDNIENDWFLNSETQQSKGTKVHMEISAKATTDLVAIFQKFQDPDTLAFNKTYTLVKLSKFKEDRFISRSQAKRLLYGLEKFQEITLDFTGVDIVGQGFVDQIYRVFQNQHSDIKLKYINANENVEFMIKRGLSTAQLG
ncbi:MAG: DUF4325 domain-containing protein [Gammaproteobacteria bacterium]|nr:DUF4325 domain-containing protein [Gammaproteobacteria bacterium]